LCAWLGACAPTTPTQSDACGMCAVVAPSSAPVSIASAAAGLAASSVSIASCLERFRPERRQPNAIAFIRTRLRASPGGMPRVERTLDAQGPRMQATSSEDAHGEYWGRRRTHVSCPWLTLARCACIWALGGEDGRRGVKERGGARGNRCAAARHVAAATRGEEDALQAAGTARHPSPSSARPLPASVDQAYRVDGSLSTFLGRLCRSSHCTAACEQPARQWVCRTKGSADNTGRDGRYRRALPVVSAGNGDAASGGPHACTALVGERSGSKQVGRATRG
jgi:hypothetical protein